MRTMIREKGREILTLKSSISMIWYDIDEDGEEIKMDDQKTDEDCRWRGRNWGGWYVDTMIELNLALTDFKGPIYFICYKRSFVRANIGKSRDISIHYWRNFVSGGSIRANFDCISSSISSIAFYLVKIVGFSCNSGGLSALSAHFMFTIQIQHDAIFFVPWECDVVQSASEIKWGTSWR